MASPREIKLRQLIWSEYRAGNDKQQARININKKLYLDYVFVSMIHSVYKRFQSGKTSIFDEGTEQYGITEAIQTLSNGNEKDICGSILFVSKDREITSDMVTSDGRFAIFSEERFIILCDLFCGEFKKIEYGEIRSISIIDYYRIFLCKIDYESSRIDLLWKGNVNSVKSILVDQLNNRNFLLYHPTAFHVCNLVNDELVIREYREFDIYTLECPKLCGNELFGLRHLERRNNAGAELMQYCKIDLVTLKEEVVEFPLLLNNQPPILIYFKGHYCWVGNKLYTIYGDIWNEISQIFLFDSDTLTWTNTGITVYGQICGLFVDKDHFLTLQVFSEDLPKYRTFYRFALKKSDTLKNIAWLSIQQDAM